MRSRAIASERAGTGTAHSIEVEIVLCRVRTRTTGPRRRFRCKRTAAVIGSEEAAWIGPKRNGVVGAALFVAMKRAGLFPAATKLST